MRTQSTKTLSMVSLLCVSGALSADRGVLTTWTKASWVARLRSRVRALFSRASNTASSPCSRPISKL
jgi:hypothetical protein